MIINNTTFEFIYDCNVTSPCLSYSSTDLLGRVINKLNCTVEQKNSTMIYRNMQILKYPSSTTTSIVMYDVVNASLSCSTSVNGSQICTCNYEPSNTMFTTNLCKNTFNASLSQSSQYLSVCNTTTKQYIWYSVGLQNKVNATGPIANTTNTTYTCMNSTEPVTLVKYQSCNVTLKNGTSN